MSRATRAIVVSTVIKILAARPKRESDTSYAETEAGA
jgi:hypothetical protein